MTNREDTELEKRLFDLARNDTKEAPMYVKQSVRNAIDRFERDKRRIYSLKRVAIIILSIGMITTSVAYGKEIVKFFKAIFTNSTPGIEAAIENGYIQNVDMDFVYDNNIGIKVDKIVKDDEIFDVSLVFDCNIQDKIDNIVLNNFSLIADDEVIFSEMQREGNSIIDSIEKQNNIYLEDNLYYKSILCKFKNKIDYNKLELLIRKIDIYKNNQLESIEGEWNIKLDIADSIKNDNDNYNDNYHANYDTSILELKNTINATNFIIDIKFNENINTDIISKYGNIRLTGENSEELMTESSDIFENDNHIVLEYDYGKFNLPDILTIMKIKKHI